MKIPGNRKKPGVIIKTSAHVKSYDGSLLILENGDFIKAETAIWTAGVKAVKITGIEQQGYLAGKRLEVDACVSSFGHPASPALTATSKFCKLSAISTLIRGITYGAIGYLFGEVIKII